MFNLTRKRIEAELRKKLAEEETRTEDERKKREAAERALEEERRKRSEAEERAKAEEEKRLAAEERANAEEKKRLEAEERARLAEEKMRAMKLEAEKEKGTPFIVVLDPNGASGERISLEVPRWTSDLEASFFLPDEPPQAFVPPTGCRFRAWLVGDDPEEKNPGSGIILDGDVCIKAVWEKIPPKEKTATVQKPSNGRKSGALKPLKSFAAPINEYSIKLSGVTFEGRQENIASAQEGDELRVIARMNNQHDPYAVEIFKGSKSLGFIPSGQNRGIHEAILRKKHVFKGYVEKIVGGGYSYNYGVIVHLSEYES